MQNLIEININTPVWALSKKGKYFVNIRESILLKAKAKGQKVKISTMGVSMICDPDEWLKTADRRFQTFLRPDQPMCLRGGFIEEKDQTNKLF